MNFAVLHNHPIHYKHLLFQEMKRQGLDFEVLYVAARSSVRHEKIPLQQELYASRTGYHGPYENAPRLSRASWTWKSLEQTSPKVLIISGLHAAECWTAWAWGILHGVPRILWYECNEFDYPRRWLKEIFKTIFLKGCRLAHVYGLSNKAYVVNLGMPAERVLSRRAVVDVAHFSRYAKTRQRPHAHPRRLLYVGRLAPEKNLGFLLKAFALAVQTSHELLLSLTLVGSGPCEQELREQCVALGIESCVVFKGYCPQKDLPSLYRVADFFILPSIREPWGLVALEAMLGQVPVLISTQCGCAADLVTPETGWTFSPAKLDELVSLLQRLPVLPADEISMMGAAAHRLASQYSPEACAQLVARSVELTDNRTPITQEVGYAE